MRYCKLVLHPVKTEAGPPLNMLLFPRGYEYTILLMRRAVFFFWPQVAVQGMPHIHGRGQPEAWLWVVGLVAILMQVGVD